MKLPEQPFARSMVNSCSTTYALAVILRDRQDRLPEHGGRLRGSCRALPAARRGSHLLSSVVIVLLNVDNPQAARWPTSSCRGTIGRPIAIGEKGGMHVASRSATALSRDRRA